MFIQFSFYCKTTTTGRPETSLKTRTNYFKLTKKLDILRASDYHCCKLQNATPPRQVMHRVQYINNCEHVCIELLVCLGSAASANPESKSALIHAKKCLTSLSWGIEQNFEKDQIHVILLDVTCPIPQSEFQIVQMINHAKQLISRVPLEIRSFKGFICLNQLKIFIFNDSTKNLSFPPCLRNLPNLNGYVSDCVAAAKSIVTPGTYLHYNLDRKQLCSEDLLCHLHLLGFFFITAVSRQFFVWIYFEKQYPEKTQLKGEEQLQNYSMTKNTCVFFPF